VLRRASAQTREHVAAHPRGLHLITNVRLTRRQKRSTTITSAR